LPQLVVLGFMHVPPWQQPVRHVSKLQFPPPRLPDDDPLDEPDDDPLDPELLPDDDVEPAHVPAWHDWLLPVQSTHDTPLKPHAESSRPTLQLPFESQQPPQVAAQPPLASSPESSAVASSVATLPELLVLPPPVPPLMSPPLVFPAPAPPLDPPDDAPVIALASRLGVTEV
jgi:hypothetical protein